MKVGDKVKLITQIYGSHKSNPYWLEHKTIGTIWKIVSGGLSIKVNWDEQGLYHNCYREEDLELVYEKILDVDELFGDIDI